MKRVYVSMTDEQVAGLKHIQVKYGIPVSVQVRHALDFVQLHRGVDLDALRLQRELEVITAQKANPDPVRDAVLALPLHEAVEKLAELKAAPKARVLVAQTEPKN